MIEKLHKCWYPTWLQMLLFVTEVDEFDDMVDTKGHASKVESNVLGIVCRFRKLGVKGKLTKSSHEVATL